MGYGSRAGARQAWAKAYRARIRGGLETRRECGVGGTRLTWGHLVPASAGGRINAWNVTILCLACNQRQGQDRWGHLVPLAAEPDFGELVAGHQNRCVIETTGRVAHGRWVTPEEVLASVGPRGEKGRRP